MSTLYHDNCSFSWYPVDVENSVRVRDSRLKSCDKKRTGIQTLRPGASTGNTAVGVLALTVHYSYNLTPQLLCVGNDGPRTAMPVHCIFIRSMAVKYRFWMEDFCHSLFSRVIILVTLCLPNLFFATHPPSHRLVLVARKHDWIYWIIWIYCANGYCPVSRSVFGIQSSVSLNSFTFLWFLRALCMIIRNTGTIYD